MGAVSRCVGVAAQCFERGEIGGDVDVEPERRVADDPDRRARAVRPRRRGARAEPGPYANANGTAVGSESTGVPSSRWSGTMTATGAPPSQTTASSDSGERKIGVHDRVPRRAASRGPGATGVRPRASSEPGSSTTSTPWRRRAHATTSGALDTITIGQSSGGVDDAIGHRPRERVALGFGEHRSEPRLAQGERPERDDDPRVVSGSTGHSLRMLPTVDAVYPAAKAVFWPWLRYGLRWTIEGAANIPDARSRPSSRAITSRISTR